MTAFGASAIPLAPPQVNVPTFQVFKSRLTFQLTIYPIPPRLSKRDGSIC